MSKCIWWPMHPRNFGSHVTVGPPTAARPPVRPSAPLAQQYKITQSTGMATQMQLKDLFGRKSHGLPLREKKQQQSRVFSEAIVIFYVYTHVDNRERPRASD